jgi:hypothetical protein
MLYMKKENTLLPQAKATFCIRYMYVLFYTAM